MLLGPVVSLPKGRQSLIFIQEPYEPLSHTSSGEASSSVNTSLITTDKENLYCRQWCPDGLFHCRDMEKSACEQRQCAACMKCSKEAKHRGGPLACRPRAYKSDSFNAKLHVYELFMRMIVIFGTRSILGRKQAVYCADCHSVYPFHH